MVMQKRTQEGRLGGKRAAGYMGNAEQFLVHSSDRRFRVTAFIKTELENSMKMKTQKTRM